MRWGWGPLGDIVLAQRAFQGPETRGLLVEMRVNPPQLGMIICPAGKSVIFYQNELSDQTWSETGGQLGRGVYGNRPHISHLPCTPKPSLNHWDRLDPQGHWLSEQRTGGVSLLGRHWSGSKVSEQFLGGKYSLTKSVGNIFVVISLLLLIRL